MLNPAYNSGNHLHPNDAGYRAMAPVPRDGGPKVKLTLAVAGPARYAWLAR